MNGNLTYEIDYGGIIRPQVASSMMQACETRIRLDYFQGAFGQTLPQLHKMRARIEGSECWHWISVTLKVDAQAKPDYTR